MGSRAEAVEAVQEGRQRRETEFSAQRDPPEKATDQLSRGLCGAGYSCRNPPESATTSAAGDEALQLLEPVLYHDDVRL